MKLHHLSQLRGYLSSIYVSNCWCCFGMISGLYGVVSEKLKEEAPLSELYYKLLIYILTWFFYYHVVLEYKIISCIFYVCWLSYQKQKQNSNITLFIDLISNCATSQLNNLKLSFTVHSFTLFRDNLFELTNFLLCCSFRNDLVSSK